MNNDNLLFEKNAVRLNKKISIRNKMIEYNNTSRIFNGITINNIIKFVNTLQDKYSNQRIPIHFNLGYIEFEDKLSYIIFECICNYLMQTGKRNVIISAMTNQSIWTEGIHSSPLLLLRKGKKENVEKYEQKFKRDIYKNHYRKVIDITEREDPYYSCKLMSDIDSFLKVYSIGKSHRDMISEVISELADNANEHAKSDCLIDIDITSRYTKEEQEDGIYYGINIAILNFSDKLLGSSIAEKIMHKDILNSRHLNLIVAYNNHKDKFSTNYLEEDFYNIASFQHKISGRLENESTGGTGLTKLISRLEECSDTYNCYVVSGNRVVWFKHKYLLYNSDNWIGFNKENDFLNCIPSVENVNKCYIYMPGTAYNLNFVMKKEEI